MIRNLLLFFLAMACCGSVFSQSINGAPRSCGGEVYGYGLSSWSSGTTYKWKITKGKRNSDNATEFCGTSADIRWDNDLAQDGKIQVYTVSSCSSPISSGTLITTFEVKRFNFTAGFAMPPAGDCHSTTSYPGLTCGTSQDIDVWFMLPINNSDYNETSAYDFAPSDANSVSLPTGWTVVTGQLIKSSYNCLPGSNYYRMWVRVRTDGIHEGDVKVRVKRNCTSGSSLYGEWSGARTLSFAAPNIYKHYSTAEPSLNICATTNAVTAAVTSSNAASYTWTTTNGYLINGLPSPVTTTASSVTISNTTGLPGTLSVVPNNCGKTGSPVSWSLNYAGGLPEISLMWYTVNYGEQRELLPYYSVPNNRVEVEYGSVEAYLGLSNHNPTLTQVEITGYNTSTYPSLGWSSGGTATYAYIQFIFDQNNAWMSWRVTAYNGCGSTVQNVAFYSLYAEDFVYAVYPNPTSSVLSISSFAKDPTSRNLAAKRKFSVSLYNERGKMLKSEKEGTGDINLNVLDVPEGKYFLHIKEGKKVIKKQVLIKH